MDCTKKNKIVFPDWSKSLWIGMESFYLWKIWSLILNLRNSFFGWSTGVCYLIFSRLKIICKAIINQLWLLSNWKIILKIWDNFCILIKKKKSTLFVLTDELFPQSWEKTEQNDLLFTKWKSIQQSSEEKGLNPTPIAVMNFPCSLD